MIGIGMRQKKRFQMPLVLIQMFEDFFCGILVVSAVDEPDFVLRFAEDADF